MQYPRLVKWSILLVTPGVLLGGCPGSDLGTEPALPPVVAGTTATNPIPVGDVATAPIPVGTSAAPRRVTGSVGPLGDYLLYDLGTARGGERWLVRPQTGSASLAFLVVLLDENFELLYREIVSPGSPLEHVARFDTGTLYLGVASPYTSRGGEFSLDILRQPGVDIPAPRPQIVYLNFAGGSNVKVHRKDATSFTPFDGAMLGSAYAGATDLIKSEIYTAMQEDYTGYHVIFVTSDDGPPPAGPHSTLHFGGSDPRLLGLADNVDQYNAELQQNAIIYVKSFEDFSVMRLTEIEMARMVANVASHEIGHLLGLFHTQVPADLMDTTGSAWDLAGTQEFSQAALEASVFPVGFANNPRRLEETVGRQPVDPAAKAKVIAKAQRFKELRKLVAEELRCRCGTCLDLDE